LMDQITWKPNYCSTTARLILTLVVWGLLAAPIISFLIDLFCRSFFVVVAVMLLFFGVLIGTLAWIVGSRMQGREWRWLRPVVYLAPFVTLFVVQYPFYDDVKHRVLIHCFESAESPEEERKALEWIVRISDVWEAYWTSRTDLPDRVQHLEGKKVFMIEWWSSPPSSDRPYRAFRVILDENNLEVFPD